MDREAGNQFMIFNDRLRLLRTEQGLTQKQMADMLGLTERNYQRYESDGPMPRYKMLLEIAETSAFHWIISLAAQKNGKSIFEQKAGRVLRPVPLVLYSLALIPSAR